MATTTNLDALLLDPVTGSASLDALLVSPITVTSSSAKVGFIDNAITTGATGCQEIHAAVAGKKIKVRHITINSTAAISITIGAGRSGTGNGVGTAIVGPLAFGALGTIQLDFNPLVELATNTALTVASSGAGQICIFAQGVIE